MTVPAPVPARAPGHGDSTAGACPTHRDGAWTSAWIGLGANLGDALATLQRALDALALRPDCREWRVSSPWRSAPVDAQGPDYVNAVASCLTRLAPADMLAALHALEDVHGRERPYHHAPRTLDLDLLAHGQTVSRRAELSLPHPRLHQRAFVLEPMLELAPTLSLPGLGRLSEHRTAVANQRVERLSGWPAPMPVPASRPPSAN